MYSPSDKNSPGIYCIFNKITEDYYIGSSSSSMILRWCSHVSLLRKNKHHSPHLQNAWNKYKADNFEFKLLEIVPKEEIKDKYYITDLEQMYFDTYFPRYNIAKIARSTLGFKHSEESKKAMSEKRKGNKSHLGRNLSEEHRKNIGNAFAKNYKVYSPEGKEFIIRNLNDFCRQYNLDNSSLNKVAQGKYNHYKQWRAYYLDN